MKVKVVIIIIIVFSSVFIKHVNAQTAFYGTTESGGKGFGVIYKTDTDGSNYEVVYEFEGLNAKKPENLNLVESSEGKLYGVTTYGGENNYGTIIGYNISTKEYDVLYSFEYGSDGDRPYGSLVLDLTEDLVYGTTKFGGDNSNGVIFRYDLTSDTYTKLFDFDESVSGKYPEYGLGISYDNNFLYGVTREGGTYGYGVLFEYCLSTDTYTVLHHFDDGVEGGYPVGEVCIYNDEEVYGLTQSGGVLNDGVLYYYNLTEGLLNVGKHLDYATTGYNPKGGPILAENDELFFALSQGGAYGYGALNRYNPIYHATTYIIDFDGTNYGAYPVGALSYDGSTRKVYGRTENSGLNGLGTIYCFDSQAEAMTKLYDYNEPNPNGFDKYGGLTLCSDGKLYGASRRGGLADCGYFYSYDISLDGYETLIDLYTPYYGGFPTGTLVQAWDGLLYGLTNSGGSYNYGTFFQFNPSTGEYNVIEEFNGTNGQEPHCTPFVAQNGKIYGTTKFGGDYGRGVIFEFDTFFQTFNVLASFEWSEGAYPEGDLFQSPDGRLFGPATSGGTYGKGTVYEFVPETNMITAMCSFRGQTYNQGEYPLGNIVQASNDKIYGVTKYGGIGNTGTLFELDTATKVMTNKRNLTGTLGVQPTGGVLLADNGKIYACANLGGSNNFGTFFEYDLATATFAVKFHFGQYANSGFYPEGKLYQSETGVIYGVTSDGASSDGTIFEYDYTSKGVSTIKQFNILDGEAPKGGMTPYQEGFLPVDLTYVSVSCENSQNEIAWKTSSEINNDYFIIERSPDAVNFEEIGKVDGAGNSNAINRYAFTDTDISGNSVYYRLKQVDIDGKVSAFKPVVCNCNRTLPGLHVSLYPNPVIDFLTVSVSGNDFKDRYYIIYNMFGEEVLSAKLAGSDFEINLTTLPKGVYIFEILNGNGICYAEKILVY